MMSAEWQVPTINLLLMLVDSIIILLFSCNDFSKESSKYPRQS